ncbi:MAG: ABC transporter substrate-binding protein [Bacteroidales bacterium]|jgi:ABC-type glycerol-3-phosphate transport system substrate-binding protein|nr:ABC transporter substrate-binding protein [Bacteroidales bacterium]
MKRKIIFLLTTAVMLSILVKLLIPVAALAQSNPNISGKLTVWAFTDELQDLIKNYIKPVYRNVNIDHSFIPIDSFRDMIEKAFASGQGVPDIFALEAQFVRRYVESGELLDLTNLYEANRDRLLRYPVEIATHNDRVYAMSWSANPGVMFYRRSLAQKYLGTDDPKVVQTYFDSLDNFADTAALIYKRSGGECVIVSSRQDLFYPFLGARQNPWIVNGRLVIDPVMDQYMDICKYFFDNHIEGRVGQWSESWFAGMRDELSDNLGDRLEVFSYFLPAWGLHYVLKPNANNTAGDWAMIPGPSSYYWGGIWLAAWKNTQNPQAARELIRYLTIDENFQERYGNETGELVTNIVVQNKIMHNFSDTYIGGQNHYAMFADISRNVNGRLIQSTDNIIQNIFLEELTSFILGEKTKAEALEDFRVGVEDLLEL